VSAIGWVRGWVWATFEGLLRVSAPCATAAMLHADSFAVLPVRMPLPRREAVAGIIARRLGAECPWEKEQHSPSVAGGWAEGRSLFWCRFVRPVTVERLASGLGFSPNRPPQSRSACKRTLAPATLTGNIVENLWLVITKRSFFGPSPTNRRLRFAAVEAEERYNRRVICDG
jgi:hypothetical protein